MILPHKGQCTECTDGKEKTIVFGWSTRWSPNAIVLCGYHNDLRKRPKQESYSKQRSWRKPTGEGELFALIWKERVHKCEECGKPLGDKWKAIFFSHILGKGAHPSLRLDPENIAINCSECHYRWDFGDRKGMKIYSKYLEYMINHGYIEKEV